MTRYRADDVLAGLKDFQRASVDHVVDRFFGPDPTRRFLLADETGLGKSVVARGVIARTLEKLQDDDSVDRVDVVYVCSNSDIAAQNVDRLRVTDDEHLAISTRLTLLSTYARRLRATTATVGKPLNLVAFTPGTSFDRGWQTGQARERALLYLLLERHLGLSGWNRRAALTTLRGGVHTTEAFRRVVEALRRELDGEPDPTIAAAFISGAEKLGLTATFEALIGEVGRSASLRGPVRAEAARLIGVLRTILAKAGVEALEPDLVILDEFQRFRHLLSVECGGESAELAHHLFDYPQAKVLLLSATPYKPFTLAQEGVDGEDHHSDFLTTLAFLCDDGDWTARTKATFAEYRDATVRGADTEGVRRELRRLLLRVMLRTERPALGRDGMLAERRHAAAPVSTADVRGYVAMRELAAHVDAPVALEYWKSAPYFVNFTDGYLLGTKLRSALEKEPTPDLTRHLRAAQLLDAGAMTRFEAIDLGNGRLRRLAEDTVGRDWWRLLWMPPSLPHYELGDDFAAAAADGITKRLVFSSWSATPTALAGLLSYEAERVLSEGGSSSNTPDARRRASGRLDFRLDGAMSTLALFWPHPALAGLGDPLAVARTGPERRMPLSDVEGSVRRNLSEAIPRAFGSPDHWGRLSRGPATSGGRAPSTPTWTPRQPSGASPGKRASNRRATGGATPASDSTSSGPGRPRRPSSR